MAPAFTPPDSPRFSAKFHLESPDVEAAKRLFTPGVRDFFLERHARTDMNPGIECDGAKLMIYVYRWASTAELEVLLDYLFGIDEALSG